VSTPPDVVLVLTGGRADTRPDLLEAVRPGAEG
jgi:hypothetical protein